MGVVRLKVALGSMIIDPFSLAFIQVPDVVTV